MPGLQQGQLANSKAKRGVLPGMYLRWTVGEAQEKMEAVVVVVHSGQGQRHSQV